MKRTLLFGILILGSTILVGFDKSNDETKSYGYPDAEKLCLDNGGDIQLSDQGSPLCLFSGLGISLIDLQNKKEESEVIMKESKICVEQGGKNEYRLEGGEEFFVCTYDDESFCYLGDLENGNCIKGMMQYGENNDLYPYAEQACIDASGALTLNEGEAQLCIFENNESCTIESIINGECEIVNKALNDQICPDEYSPVCGVDGNTYTNRCYLEQAGVEEETEMAEIVDGVCVFG